jgi:energy-coupling factor transporter ATP-binding protein EcfA2
MTVIENMKLGATNQRGESLFASVFPFLWRKQEKEIEQRADELLVHFKMDHMRDEFAGTLSGGQRKLLEMARSLMVQPAMVMLDEPMAGVNPALTQSLLGHVKDLREQGMTVLFVEHDMDVVMEHCDRVVVMHDGRTLAVGHIFRHHPALRDLKRRIDRGEFGKIKYIVTNRLTFRAPRTTTGVLYSLAVHDVDIYNMLLDDTPDHLYCRLDSFLRDGIDESAPIVTGYGDPTGGINESWQLPMFGKRRDLGIVGTRRAAYIDYLEDTELEIYDAKVVKEQGVMQAVEEGSTTVEVEGYEPLKQEVEDFVAASESGEEPVASGRIGAETVELLEIAKESADAGDTMDLS